MLQNVPKNVILFLSLKLNEIRVWCSPIKIWFLFGFVLNLPLRFFKPGTHTVQSNKPKNQTNEHVTFVSLEGRE